MPGDGIKERRMRKGLCMILAAALLFGAALAETEAILPGGTYRMLVPDGMTYSAPETGAAEIHAWFSDELEINYTAYPRAVLFQTGEAQTLQTLAEKRIEAGENVEIRDVNGIPMLVYRLVDEADGAPGIGYLFEDGSRIIEILFWYATQAAADRTGDIIASVQRIQD